MSRAISTVIGAGAYIALAIAGWGGPAAFFSHPPLTAAIIVMIVLTVAGLVAPGGNISPGVREDRSNRWVILVITVIGLVNAWLPAYTDRRNFWTIDGDPVRWAGVVLLAAGGALRIWPLFVLKDRFSGLVAIQPGHTLVATGVYGSIRHPSYLGLLTNSAGWSLAFRSGAGLLMTALLIPALVARMNSEEKLLGEQFDGEYEEYRKRTARLIPGAY